MSVSLKCPNCGAEIGTASHEDNYTEHFKSFNKKGQPYCDNCGAGKHTSGSIFLSGLFFFGLFFAIVLGLYFLINLL